jgi:hypothetical protein
MKKSNRMKEVIGVFLMTIVFMSCNYNGSNKSETESHETESNHSLNQEMPTNRIHAWSDGCGFSFELHEGTMWAFDGNEIRYNRLNDSIFEVIYPEKPQIFKNFKIQTYEGGRYISFDKNQAYCLDETKNEIPFGADRLKFEIVSSNSIKVFFPKKSTWKISRISDEEIFIYNEKNKVEYKRFLD